MSAKKIADWKLNKASYNQIQQLKLFVDFIVGLEIFDKKETYKAIEIKQLIENINNPSTFKNWNICLDIYDRNIQNGTNKNGGFYWRKWSVSFENNMLEITAESKHTNENIGHYGTDFYYYGGVFFQKKMKEKRIYLDTPITEFIQDAKNYKNYVTKTLNDIYIEIDIW